MTRNQWVILIVLSGVVGWMLLAQLWLAHKVQGLNQGVIQTQMEINQARQKDLLIRQLTLRIAQEAQQDKPLQDLMKRRDLKVVITQDGVQKNFP
ncbi:MAG: hypothetical protein ACOY3I_09705 [Verrucomicrobiota bacterium]